MKIILVFCALFAFTYAQNPVVTPTCTGQGEEPNTCGSACPATCESIKSKEPMMCTMQCVSGCFCKQGLVRSPDGKCIEPKDCPATEKCNKPHQKFTECGTACPKSCKNPNPEVCTANCVRGCVCETGYILDDQGNCVEPSKCPVPQCPANEQWSNGTCVAPPMCYSSSTHCPNNKDKRMCKIRCSGGGCVCKKGYLRDNQNVCVKANQCNVNGSKCTKPHQIYKECGSACPKTCKNRKPEACTEQCVQGCFCEDGFLQDDQGNCIEPKKCPAPQCPANEHWVNDQCIPPPMCSGDYHCPNNKDKIMCKIPCSKPEDYGGCVCNDGYLRDNQYVCVKADQCNVNSSDTNQCTKPNQVFKTCGTACEATCAKPTPSPVCTKQCVKGCFCTEGYLKNNAGDCVIPKNCFSKINEPVCKNRAHMQWSNNSCECQEPVCPNNTVKRNNCATVCKSGCVCDQGYYRDDKNNCVALDQCNKDRGIECPRNEHWYTERCVPPPRCQGPKCPNNRVDIQCSVACLGSGGCICNDGYYRDEKATCVKLDECNEKVLSRKRTSTTPKSG